jgi:hypothetical protein
VGIGNLGFGVGEGGDHGSTERGSTRISVALVVASDHIHPRKMSRATSSSEGRRSRAQQSAHRSQRA